MKDIIITARRKKMELITLLICFILANLANIYAIIVYRTPAVELLTSMGYVLFATVFFYAIWGVLRLLYYGIKNIFTKKK